MKLFGMLGFGCGLLSMLAGLAVVLMKLGAGVDMTGNPLLLLAAFSMMVCVQFLSLGLLGEVSARIYFGRQGRQHFTVRELINFDPPEEPAPPARASGVRAIRISALFVERNSFRFERIEIRSTLVAAEGRVG